MRTLVLGLFAAFALGCGGRIEAEAADAGLDASSSAPTTPTTPTLPGSGTDEEAGAPSSLPCAPTGFRASDVGTACFDEAHWKEIAADACEFKGGVATLRLDTPCGFFRYRNYRCCGADGACTDHRDGGPSSCKDVATWRTYSEKDCALEGRALVSMTTDTPCGGAGGALGATYQCCKP